MEISITKRGAIFAISAVAVTLLFVYLVFGFSILVNAIFIEIGALVGYGLVLWIRNPKWVTKFAVLGLLSFPVAIGGALAVFLLGLKVWLPSTNGIVQSFFTGFQSAFVLFILRKWFYQTIDNAEARKRIRRDSVES